jgi:hypothetical protein
MTFGAVDIPNRGVDDFREALRAREAELVNAKKQRDVILNDIRKASAAIDAGDKKARFAQGSLNKQDAEVGRLILSLEAEVREKKKRLAMAEDQVKAMEAKRMSADTLPRDKWFAVTCPDGRAVRHRHSSMDALQKELQPGYRAIGQVFGANEDGTGGFISQPDAPSMLKALLESQGDELLAFLARHGIVGADKQSVVVLPSNNREMQ